MDILENLNTLMTKEEGNSKSNLLAKITKCGAISPRFKVKNDEFNNWEQQYLACI